MLGELPPKSSWAKRRLLRPTVPEMSMKLSLCVLLVAIGCRGQESSSNDPTGGESGNSKNQLETYMMRSRALEAPQMLNKLVSGARMYFESEHLSRDSIQVISRQLPASTPSPTPAKGTCCGNDRARCAPDAAQWQQATWLALNFSIEQPHFYSYEFRNKGGHFSALAYGDLDCDGIYSTYSISGKATRVGLEVGELTISQRLE